MFERSEKKSKINTGNKKLYMLLIFELNYFVHLLIKELYPCQKFQ